MKVIKIALVSLVVAGSLFSKGFDVKQSESKPVDEIGSFVSLVNDVSDGTVNNTTIVVNELNFNNREVLFQSQKDLIIDCKDSRVGNGILTYAPKKIINPNYVPKIELNNCNFVDITIRNGTKELPLNISLNNSKGSIYVDGNPDNENNFMSIQSSKLEKLRTRSITQQEVIQTIVDLYECENGINTDNENHFSFFINSVIKNTKNFSDLYYGVSQRSYFINSIFTSAEKLERSSKYVFINSFVKAEFGWNNDYAINSIIKGSLSVRKRGDSSYFTNSSDIKEHPEVLKDKEFENIPFTKPDESSPLRYKGLSPDKVSEIIIIPEKYQKYLYVDMLGTKRDLSAPTVGPFEIIGGKKGF